MIPITLLSITVLACIVTIARQKQKLREREYEALELHARNVELIDEIARIHASYKPRM